MEPPQLCGNMGHSWGAYVDQLGLFSQHVGDIS